MPFSSPHLKAEAPTAQLQMQKQATAAAHLNIGTVDDFRVAPKSITPMYMRARPQQQTQGDGASKQKRSNTTYKTTSSTRNTQGKQKTPNKNQHPMQKHSKKTEEKNLPLIRFNHVTKYYDTSTEMKSCKPALIDFTLDIDNGEFVFLIGHSGSGKSTIISLITRENKPTEGEIIVAGQRLSEIRNWRVPYYRRNIGCVFQDFRLLENKTIYENVAFILEIIGKPESEIKALVPEALHIVGLDGKANKYPSQLSGGEQQRASIARAIINRPPILICDEPTGNLDPANTLGIMALLEKLNEIGHTIVMATHDMNMIQKTEHRVIELSEGKMVRDSKTEGVAANA